MSGPSSRLPWPTWAAGALVLGAGLTLGLFLARVLAQMPWVTWPFYRPAWTAALALLSGGAFLALWWPRAVAVRSSMPAVVPFYLLWVYIARPSIDPVHAAVLIVGVAALWLLLRLDRPPAGERAIVLVLFLLPFAVYLATLTPAVGTRDGYELQAISATLGFAHPTGYPLFPILGRLWLLIWPLGSIAWRINVLCALFAAASIPLVYGTARRVLGRPSFAILTALSFAFSQTLWTQAVRPEKYTLNALLVALVLYLAFGTVDPQARGPHPALRWLALAYGISLGHHRTMLMLAPALGLYVLWRDPGLLKRPREWLPALGLALAPLLIYVYIPWRAAVQGWYMTLGEFLRYISGAYYGPAVRLGDWLNPERVQMFWRFLVMQYGPPGIALGLLGLVGLALRRQWRFLACSGAAYLTYYFWGTVWYAYYNDVNSFIPNHMLFAFWIGSGALALWQASERLLSPRVQAVLRPAFWSLAALLPLWLVWSNAAPVDARGEWNLTSWGEYAIAQDIAPGATILADRDKHPPLDYFARIERRRPDVDVVILGDERAYLDRLAWDLAHDKTVYLARFLPGLDGPYHLRSLGPLVEVGTAPLPASSAGSSADAVRFGERVDLLRSEIESPDAPRAGDPLYVNLYWRADQAVGGNYQVHLRLVGESDIVWWQEGDHPVSGMYPTAAWKPGEVVRDWHQVSIPETIPPGQYQIQVGLLAPFSEQGLPHPGGSFWLAIDSISVAPGPIEISNPLRAIRPGEWQWVGYDMPRQAPPGGRVALTLYWQALAPLTELEIGTRVAAAGEEGIWQWEKPGQGTYASTEWQPGQTAATTHMLIMPSQPGTAVVEVAVRPAAGGEPLAFYGGWLARRDTALALPPITLAGQPPAGPGTANFGDRILLLEANLPEQTLPAGGAANLSLRWQGLQDMAEDYTLFIQLLAPDGTPHGQIDVWPLKGTHPTSAWREAEVIEESYQIYLDANAPAGRYQVAVGWYLLETMQRLPVLDAEGRAIEDKVLLPGLAVAP